MDWVAYCEELAGELRGLLIRLEDRLGAHADEVAGYIDANELGLALEFMADVVSDAGAALSAAERADLLALAERMETGDRVPAALALCPSSP